VAKYPDYQGLIVIARFDRAIQATARRSIQTAVGTRSVASGNRSAPRTRITLRSIQVTSWDEQDALAAEHEAFAAAALDGALVVGDAGAGGGAGAG